MAYILAELDRVQFGVSCGTRWSQHLDHVARAALRRLVPVNTAVVAAGEWGRGDGCPGLVPSAFLVGPRAHLVVVMDELRYVLPSVSFLFDMPDPLMREQLHNGRVIWGHAAAPAAPVGDAFAAEWAAAKSAQRRHLSKTSSPVQLALYDFQTLRSICCMVQLPIPPLLDLPARVADLYVARNMAKTELPEPSRDFARQLAACARSSLNLLVKGAPVAGIAAMPHQWLFC